MSTDIMKEAVAKSVSYSCTQ